MHLQFATYGGICNWVNIQHVAEAWLNMVIAKIFLKEMPLFCMSLTKYVQITKDNLKFIIVIVKQDLKRPLLIKIKEPQQSWIIFQKQFSKTIIIVIWMYVYMCVNIKYNFSKLCEVHVFVPYPEPVLNTIHSTGAAVTLCEL